MINDITWLKSWVITLTNDGKSDLKKSTVIFSWHSSHAQAKPRPPVRDKRSINN